MIVAIIFLLILLALGGSEEAGNILVGGMLLVSVFCMIFSLFV